MTKVEKNRAIHLRQLTVMVFIAVLSFLLFSCISADSNVSSDGDFTDGDYVIDGDADDLSGLISVELTPSAESGFLPQQIVDLDLDNFDGTLTLKDSVVYSGEIRPYTEAVVTLVPSTNDENYPMISGHSLPGKSVETTSESDIAEGTLHSVFSMTVIPGTYTRYIYPKDQTLAPPLISHNGLTITEDLEEVNWIEEGLLVEGYVMLSDGTPVKDINVTAYATNPWRRSSLSVTGADNGNADGDIDYEAEGGRSEDLSEGKFSFLLSDISASYSIVLKPSSNDMMYPELTISNAIVVNDGETSFNPDLELDSQGRLLLYYEEFDQTSCTVSGQVKIDNKTVSGIENTKVVFKSKLIGGGTFERFAMANENGDYSIDLLATTSEVPNSFYKVSVQTPQDSQYASLIVSNVECNEKSKALDFVLDLKPVVSGKITSSEDIPIENVEVLATKLATETDSYVYVKSVLTDSEGNYSLSIDAGLYDFLFIPPEDTSLGRSYLREVETSTDGTIDQTLYTGQPFAGKVKDAQGISVPWVYIEIYQKRFGSGTYEPVGSGSTNEKGEFNIILPQLP